MLCRVMPLLALRRLSNQYEHVSNLKNFYSWFSPDVIAFMLVHRTKVKKNRLVI